MATILRICLFLLIIFPQTSDVCAQFNDMSVDMLNSGRAPSREEAEQAALRSAINDVYEVFVPAHATPFNANTPADEMADDISAIVQTYQVVNASQLPHGDWVVLVKSIVSMRKLSSFVQIKVGARQINCSLLDLKAKQLMLHRQCEVNVTGDLVAVLHEVLQTSFNFRLICDEADSISKADHIRLKPLQVSAVTNDQIDFCAGLCIKTLSVLAQIDNDLDNYRFPNRQVFPVSITWKGKETTFYLQQQVSVILLSALVRNWDFYAGNYSVSGFKKQLRPAENKLQFPFGEIKDGKENYKVATDISLNFPASGTQTGLFDLEDESMLPSKKMIGEFDVETQGFRSEIKHGGYVIFEDKHGHGLVAAIADIGEFDGNLARKCEGMQFMGYNDWSLPGKFELTAIFQNLCKKGFGGFNKANPGYWSFETAGGYATDIAGYLSFDNGNYTTNYEDKNRLLSVRLVRKY